MTPNRSTGFTLFFLVYGAEAVIPTDIEFDASRVMMFTEVQAKEAPEGSGAGRLRRHPPPSLGIPDTLRTPRPLTSP